MVYAVVDLVWAAWAADTGSILPGAAWDTCTKTNGMETFAQSVFYRSFAHHVYDTMWHSVVVLGCPGGMVNQAWLGKTEKLFCDN